MFNRGMAWETDHSFIGDFFGEISFFNWIMCCLLYTSCFGDGPNDVEMFETVAHPIAMGNAIEIIKEKAETVCLSIHEDGVAHKLNELFDL